MKKEPERKQGIVPDTVKVGAYTVRVVYVENLMTDKDQCGIYSSREKCIRLDPDMTPELIFGVFMHELVEAIADIYAIDPLEKDHHAIDQLGEALHQVLRDNGMEILP